LNSKINPSSDLLSTNFKGKKTSNINFIHQMETIWHKYHSFLWSKLILMILFSLYRRNMTTSLSSLSTRY
jgi:hypothetical protein